MVGFCGLEQEPLEASTVDELLNLPEDTVSIRYTVSHRLTLSQQCVIRQRQMQIQCMILLVSQAQYHAPLCQLHACVTANSLGCLWLHTLHPLWRG